ncbi:hypothetical protein GCM10025787_29710 [Saccharopolyspora rosea]
MPSTGWFKSTYSNPSQSCVEVNFDGDLVHVRDSKNRGEGPVLTIPARHWAAFLDEVAGRAEDESNPALRIVRAQDGGASLHTRRGAARTLSYTPSEWSAFVAGVHAGEFDLPPADAPAA